MTAPNWLKKRIKVWNFTVGFYALELYRAYSIIFISHLKPFNNNLKAFEQTVLFVYIVLFVVVILLKCFYKNYL